MLVQVLVDILGLLSALLQMDRIPLFGIDMQASEKQSSRSYLDAKPRLVIDAKPAFPDCGSGSGQLVLVAKSHAQS
jgi:hypothetical protein